MSPAKKPASRRRSTTARKRQGAKEPAAIKRLNKALDSAQEALVSLRKDVGREVGAGGRGLHKNLERFVKEARRDSGRLSKAIERDIQRLQKRLPGGSKAKASGRAGSRRKTTGRTTAKRAGSRTTAKRAGSRTTARRAGGRTTARRAGSRTTARRTTRRSPARRTTRRS